jgi:ATP synthase I subunit
MVVIAVAALIASFPQFGWRTTLGFAIGAAVSGVNFYWLQKVVAGMAAAAVSSGKAPSSRGVVRRFLLRYFLMAIAAFVILTVSRDSLYGFFAGLFLPVAAILCEAGYEVYKVIRG